MLSCVQTDAHLYYPIVPWAAPCYLATYNATQCAAVSNNYLDGFSRADAIGATQELNWFVLSPSSYPMLCASVLINVLCPILLMSQGGLRNRQLLPFLWR